MPLLQFILLGAVAIWAFTPDKGLDLPQFGVLPFFLVCVWLSLGFAGWWGGIVPALNTMLPPILYFVVLSGCIRSIAVVPQVHPADGAVRGRAGTAWPLPEHARNQLDRTAHDRGAHHVLGHLQRPQRHGPAVRDVRGILHLSPAHLAPATGQVAGPGHSRMAALWRLSDRFARHHAGGAGGIGTRARILVWQDAR